MKRGRKPKCPYCGKSRTISKGHRKTATMGKRPLRICKDCGRRFTVNGNSKPSAKTKKSKRPATKRRTAVAAVVGHEAS